MILVGKASRLSSSLELVRRGQRAVAVVGDGGHDGVGRAVIGDALVQAERVGASLAQHVRVRARCLVADRAQRDGAIGVVGAGRDNHAVLEQLKRELACCKVASGQTLDRLDLIGHHRIGRRHAVGVGEREGSAVVTLAHDLQMSGTVVSHGVGNLTRGVGVVGHARGATGLGHRVGKGVRTRGNGGCGLGLAAGLVGIGISVDVGLFSLCLVGLGFVSFVCLGLIGRIIRHAQGAVEVLERKVDLAKVHVAGRVVGCGRALGHRGARLIGGHGKGELTRDIGRGQALGSLELLGAGERGVNGLGAVDVLEHGLDATVVRLRRQSAVAVVDDDDLKAKARLRGSNTLCCERGRVLKRRVVDSPRKLGIRVGTDGASGAHQIGEHLSRVMQRAKAHLAVDVGRHSAVNGFRLARIGDAKVELAVGQRTTGQGLGGDNLRKLAARVIGRCVVAVGERDHGALDLVLAALVDRRMRALGSAGNDRRGGERAGTIVGDSDRHGALGVIVGVTGLAIVLLGNGVCKGLARVSLRKLDLMASQDVDQTNRCLCRCRGLVHVGALVQAERDGRSLVGGRHGKGELTLGHGTSGEGLAELKAAGRGVVELSVVLVGKAAAFLLGDVGDQDALAVISHGYFGGCDMRVIRHTGRAARVLADLVLVGSGSRVVDLAELDGGDAILRVLLAHSYGCGVGQRGALGGRDGKAKLVCIRPVATVDGLAQAKVELCVERGHAVSVLESCSLDVVLQDMLGLESAVAVIGDGGLDAVLGIAVGDTAGVALDLAQRIGVRSGLGVLDGAHRDLAIGGVLAGGDDLGVLALALDELEGELAVLEVAPGQDLGRGDLVGDAGARRRQVVGILKLGGLCALQLVRSAERTVTVVGDGGHDGIGLAVVGDAVAGGSALGLAQRVGVFAGLCVLDGAHRDLAVGIVGAGGDDLGALALALDELEGELAFLEIAPGQDLGRLDPVGDAGALGGHAVGVLELNLLNILGALQLMRGHKLALAIVGDGRHDGIDGFVVGDAAGIALNLAQRIDVLTNLGVLDSAERNLAASVILNGLDNRRVLALALDELKGELIGLELMAGQDLGDCNLIGDARLGGIGGVGVLELGLARGLLHGSLELAPCVGLHRHGELRNVLAVGDAMDRGSGMLLANLVDIRARLVIGNLAKANVRMALGRNRSRGFGHRGVVLGRQVKLKLVLVRPIAALEHLGQAKAGLGIHRCWRHIKRKANLAVVAQINIDLRRAGNNLRVVPLGIDYVECSVRRVSAHTLLGGVELIDKGEARGASLNRPVIVILYQSAFKAFELASLNRDRNGIIVRRARRVLRHKLIFVPIGLRARRLFRCKLGASCVRIDGR